MTSSIKATGPSPNKRARLNPARRKAAKAKSAEQSTKRSPSDTEVGAKCSSLQDLGLRLETTKPVSSQAKVSQAASASQSGIQKLSASKTQLQHGQIATIQSKNDKPRHSDTPRGSNVATLGTPAFVTGGLLGCAAGAAIVLGASLWRQIDGADSAILAARTSKMVVNNLIDEVIASIKAGTYNAPEALDVLRRTTLVYASTIPGGAAFVEHLFREIDVVRKQRGGEVDRALAETCNELANVRKMGASASETHVTVLRQLAKLSTFTSNATRDVLARNPGLRPFLPVAEKQKVPTLNVNLHIKQNGKGVSAA